MPPAIVSAEDPYPHPQSDGLLKQAFGKERLTRGVYQLRAGMPVADLCRSVMMGDELIAVIRYWEIALAADGRRLNAYRWLLLGPLAVADAYSQQGYGALLVQQSLALAKQLPYQGIFVSGDADYYQRFGFIPIALDAPPSTKPNIWQILQLKTPIALTGVPLRLMLG